MSKTVYTSNSRISQVRKDAEALGYALDYEVLDGSVLYHLWKKGSIMYSASHLKDIERFLKFKKEEN